jgi:hypothetical protein
VRGETIPEMTPWRNKAHEARCEGKHGFKKAEVAEQSAHTASLRTGQLIISYRCYDCGLWHIGHADQSQNQAHQTKTGIDQQSVVGQGPDKPLCVVCGNEIPMVRISRARECDSDTPVCSEACAKARRNRKIRKKRKARMKAGKQAGIVESEEPHPVEGDRGSSIFLLLSASFPSFASGVPRKNLNPRSSVSTASRRLPDSQRATASAITPYSEFRSFLLSSRMSHKLVFAAFLRLQPWKNAASRIHSSRKSFGAVLASARQRSR